MPTIFFEGWKIADTFLGLEKPEFVVILSLPSSSLKTQFKLRTNIVQWGHYTLPTWGASIFCRSLKYISKVFFSLILTQFCLPCQTLLEILNGQETVPKFI